jgi:hypothetical protein
MDEAGQLEAGGSSIGRTSTKPAPDGRASEHVFVGHPSGKWARVRHVATPDTAVSYDTRPDRSCLAVFLADASRAR